MLCDGLGHVWVGAIADLHGVPVEQGMELVPGGERLIQDPQEPLAHVSGDGDGEGRVEPGDLPASLLPPRRLGLRLGVLELVLVAGGVQGVLVRPGGRPELLLVAGDLAQTPVHCHRDVADDGGRTIRPGGKLLSKYPVYYLPAC